MPLSAHSQCSDKQLPDWTRRVLIKDHFRNGDGARGLLIFIHIVTCCISLVVLASAPTSIADPATFHIFFQIKQLPIAVAIISAFALVGTSFVFAPPTIGYFIGFYLYTAILSYLWLNCFTDLNYHHFLSGASAFTSCALFLFPALFIARPFAPALRISTAAFDRLLLAIICISAVVTCAGAYYSFRLAAIEDLSTLREKIVFPKLLNYLLAMTTSALLPFAFAGFTARKKYLLAAFVIILQALLYPVTLSKLALFAPLWLIALYFLTARLEPRTAIILSLLLPLLMGLIGFEMVGSNAAKLRFFDHQFPDDRDPCPSFGRL